MRRANTQCHVNFRRVAEVTIPHWLSEVLVRDQLRGTYGVGRLGHVCKEVRRKERWERRAACGGSECVYIGMKIELRWPTTSNIHRARAARF